MSETVWAEWVDQGIYLASKYLSCQEAAEKRPERHAAVGEGFVIARELWDRAHAGQTILRYWANTDPDILNLRIVERRNYRSRALQQLVAE